MRETGFVFMLFILTIQTIAQETITKSEYYSNSTQLKSSLYVLKSDTTIKHGNAIFYKKIDETDYKYFKNKNQNRLIVAKGQYDNNEKIGIWEFFMNPKFYYDFDREKLITFQLRHN